MRTRFTLASRTPLAVAVATLMAAGCAVGPDYHRPTLPAADGYTRTPLATTGSNSIPGGTAQRFTSGGPLPQQWWTALGSPEINQLVQTAFAHSPTIDAARAALRQAHENTAAQFGSFFPVLQASYSPSRQLNAVGTISPTLTSGAPEYTLHTAQLSISYTPDVFGLNRRSVESLTAQEEAQRDQLDAAYTTLAANVVSTAIQIGAEQAQLDAANQAVTAQRHALDILHQQIKAGAASALDVAAQESATAQSEAALPPLEKQLEQSRDLLATLVGEVPSSARRQLDLDKLTLPADLPVSLPSTLVNQRPDVRAAEAQVHAASANVGVAVANRLPQFSISGLWGGTATQFDKMFTDNNRFWGITGNITQTIFDYGTLGHRQHAAEAAFDQAKAQYRSVVLTAFQNVADSLYAIQADAKWLTASAQAEMAAKKTLDLTQRQLDVGAINILAQLNAVQTYQQARITRIQAQAARYTDTVALYQALGGSWEIGADGQAVVR